MADASVFAMENIDFKNTYPANSTEIRNCHINIGTGIEISIKELAGLISNTVDYAGEIKFDASKPNGTMRKLTDVSKLNNLGWKHKIEIDEGVKILYEWYIK
jgi:GDP-L-fucose synthase